jgi:hypothetical protein
MKSDHVDELTLALYVSGYTDLQPAIAKVVRDHLRDCLGCVERMEERMAELSESEEFDESSLSNGDMID